LAHQSKEIFCHYFLLQTITRHIAEDVENQVPQSLMTTTTVPASATFRAYTVLRTRFHWHLHRTNRVITSSHRLRRLISMHMYKTGAAIAGRYRARCRGVATSRASHWNTHEFTSRLRCPPVYLSNSRTVPEIGQRSFACTGTSLRYSVITIRGDAVTARSIRTILHSKLIIKIRG
jgi:hypothetical protein